MRLPPVLLRELQVQARQPATMRMRWISAAVVMGIWMVLMLISARTSAQERAWIMFITIGAASLGFALLAGVFQTADCLSEERREGTLGLLFLTELRGYDVVFGKLAATSLRCFYTLLAIVPVFAFPFLLGGVTAGEFWRVTLVLLVTLYVSLAVGMLVSALSRDARAAMGGTFLLLLGCAGAIPLLCWSANRNSWGIRLDALLWACPPYAFRAAFHDIYTTPAGADSFWKCIATLFTLGMAALVGASWILPQQWRDDGGGKSKRRDVSPTASTVVAARKLILGDNDPFVWLASRDSRPRRILKWTFAVLLPLWGCLYTVMWLIPVSSQGAMFLNLTILTIGLHLLLKVVVAAEVTRRFSEDKQTGVLEILLVAPVTVHQMATGLVRAVWRSFYGWVTLICLLHLAICGWAVRSEFFDINNDSLGYLILATGGGMLLLVLDGIALVNVGMWMALVKRRHSHAIFANVRQVLLPPWLIAMGLFVIGVGAGGLQAWAGPMIIWFAFCFVWDIGVVVTAMTKLRRDFRAIAALGPILAKQTEIQQPPESELLWVSDPVAGPNS